MCTNADHSLAADITEGSPVVRVGPDHVHIKDIDAYEKSVPTNGTVPRSFLTFTRVFRNGTNFEKDHVFYTCADNDGSIFSLSNRDEHRARRKALSPRFSKKAAEADAPAILNQIRLLEGFIIQHSSLEKSCNVSDLFRVFGINIVAKTLLGDCHDLVQYEEAKPELLETVDGLSVMLPILRFFPYMGTISNIMPSFIAEQLTPAGVLSFKKTCEDYTQSMMDKPIRSDVESSRSSVMEILMAHSLETTGKLPKLNYLTAEAFTFIDAGVDTTGRTLAAAVYYVLRTPSVEKKLQEELDSLSLWGSENTEDIVRNVGKLPYLNAVIKEAHRIWPSLPGPLPRVVPSEGLQVGSYFIPQGTIVSATHHSMHFDEDIFPEPKTFKPERWLRDDSTELNRYLTPYSRGSRACIGIN
ncbi:hypothetical protein PENARI_c033G04918 [Penicillium arizonense]|uniref:Cytochrome P450 n=1 Tax=Penicillium arizonense TaxID=1835702 RepID=A0A1F5L489_PENAI|nr:hypothetical protein PENARI_c033G04918 [Penicillium arizonense]OGE48035.1 hypothetical protein PENARI_c033G04918 [Penicillium arizonense]